MFRLYEKKKEKKTHTIYIYIHLYTLERKCSYIDFYKLRNNPVCLALNIPLISKTHQNQQAF